MPPDPDPEPPDPDKLAEESREALDKIRGMFLPEESYPAEEPPLFPSKPPTDSPPR